MLDDALISELLAFGRVVLIDLVLAGDNALVVGMAAASLPPKQQRQAIMIGIGAAILFRVIFAVMVMQLMAIIGLLLAGGLLLLWVAWKLWREIRMGMAQHSLDAVAADPVSGGPIPTERKSFSSAVWQITIADISMSLDNVLAVAGAARDHLWPLIAGLVLSVALMGVAAAAAARLMQRHPWIAYAGLLVILYVALQMIWEGADEVADAVASAVAEP